MVTIQRVGSPDGSVRTLAPGTARDRLSRGFGFREARSDQRPKRAGPREQVEMIITDVPGRTTINEEPDGSIVVDGAVISVSGRPDDDEHPVILTGVFASFVAGSFEEAGFSVSATGHLSDGHWFVSRVGFVKTGSTTNGGRKA